ncbi:MAGE family protein [Colletotrichum tofieldiae]|nr:MAGE family protein [Colletotrichum tofieldiae]
MLSVLGDQGRAFRKVFDLAQQQLRTVWGMELQELAVREKFTMAEKRQGKSKEELEVRDNGD